MMMDTLAEAGKGDYGLICVYLVMQVKDTLAFLFFNLMQDGPVLLIG